MKSTRITPFLWFNGRKGKSAQDAVRFYLKIFKGRSKVISDNGMSVEFELNSQRFIGLNAGPQFKFNEAVSFFISCKDQKEVDYYWKRLSKGGRISRCGWLKDRFGLWWQVIPTRLGELLSNDDTGQVMQAMLKMRKIEVKKLEEAARKV